MTANRRPLLHVYCTLTAEPDQADVELLARRHRGTAPPHVQLGRCLRAGGPGLAERESATCGRHYCPLATAGNGPANGPSLMSAERDWPSWLAAPLVFGED